MASVAPLALGLRNSIYFRYEQPDLGGYQSEKSFRDSEAVRLIGPSMEEYHYQ